MSRSPATCGDGGVPADDGHRALVAVAVRPRVGLAADGREDRARGVAALLQRRRGEHRLVTGEVADRVDVREAGRAQPVVDDEARGAPALERAGVR